jgi:hypothetical protein
MMTISPSARLVSFALCGLLAPLLAHCEKEPKRCIPGQSIACVSNGCDGHQVCQDDGKSYGDCICGENSGDFAEAGPNSGLIGAACNQDDECRRGLECIQSKATMIAGEGPSGGMCLARCLMEHDFCQGLDALSKCVVVDDLGTPADRLDDIAFCMPGCSLGTQANELDKCRGRSDLACVATTKGSNTGYCRPVCRSDIDCGNRFCDLSTGLCGNDESKGDPIGASCESEANASTCTGACLSLNDDYSECSGVCRFGSPGCGQENTDSQLDYYCLRESAAGVGDGDLGYCAKLCDCDDECDRVDAVCEPNSSLESLAGRSGVCGPKQLPSGANRQNLPCR